MPSPRRPGPTPAQLLTARAASIFSWGYAVIVIWATLTFDLSFSVLEGVAIMSLFLVLRALTNELHRDVHRARRSAVQHAVRIRAASPRHWTTEQRDGLGRRIDRSA